MFPFEDSDDSDAKSEGPVEYRLSGTGGHAKSTEGTKKASLKHFNDFLITKKMPSFEKLSESQLCNIRLFQEYGTYLSEHARKKNKVRNKPLIIQHNSNNVQMRIGQRVAQMGNSETVY
jgi:hypothetical protein